jgi:putative oxygen-independent coproporphyrinogen III oxidase
MSIPASLYIHIPWCLKKCPYCDFNSHQKPQELSEQSYVHQLLNDFKHDLGRFPRTQLHSIFIGGGTPSLFSPEAYAMLFNGLKQLIVWPQDMEVTIEANPGAIDSGRFHEYQALGINRLSIGVQSFQNEYLKKLGRVHDAKTAHHAIELAQKVGFEAINVDLMYGLPGQNVEDAIQDLKEAIFHQTQHLSWYELTIEPNTIFYKKPPTQPQEDVFIEIENKGHALLDKSDFKRYEISAYAKPNQQCQHNTNYWKYGDYFGIGAGAHAKLTASHYQIKRFHKLKMPNRYLQETNSFIVEENTISQTQDIIFEFMLNTARLLQPISFSWFQEVTGLNPQILEPYFKLALELEFITVSEKDWQITNKGIQFNNEFMQLFMD